MNEDEKFIVQNNMMQYGGSFVKALGKALSHADVENSYKIKEIFPEYWEEYSKDDYKYE